MVFGVLFGFRRSDFRSSDHFPEIETEYKVFIVNNNLLFLIKLPQNIVVNVKIDAN
jgi:hypothetical protein